jgi:magnesium transporter
MSDNNTAGRAQPHGDIDFEALKAAIAERDGLAMDAELSSISEVDARHAFFKLSETEQDVVLQGTSLELICDLLEPLPDLEIALLLERIPPSRAAELLSGFTTADQAQIIEELDEQDAEAVTAEFAPDSATEINKLLDYPENSAGRLMDPSPISFSGDESVGVVLKRIVEDESALDSADGQHPYVVDERGALSGVLSLRDLLTARRPTSLNEIMRPADFISEFADLDEIRDFFDERDFLGVPVVNDEGILVGALSKDAAMDAVRARLQTNAEKARGGVADELRSMPLLFRSRRRLSWLTANIGLNIIAASVIASFEPTLAAVITLAIFLPMVSDMSGCSGNQAVAVSMREISLGLARPGDIFRVWRKEILIGAINGVVLGTVIGLVAWVWKGNAVLGGVIGLALAVNTMIAVSIGGCVPLILKRFRVDPAVASGPLLTTITDMAGFFLVLGLATLALPWLI